MSDFFTSRFQTISDYFGSQSFSLGNFGNLFSWDFWTEANIDPSSQYTAATLLLTIAIIAGLIIWRRILKKRHATTPVYDWPINQLTNMIALLVIITPSYWFFRSQQLAYLSSRLVVLTTLLITMGWLGWVIFRLIRTVPGNRAAYLEKERFFRYLPKSKKMKNNS
ncbi:MAG: hypothetical protein WEC83_00875 [Patescibacteria group bacterium]